ncbi:TetR family transcriptional regulator [Tsukamurella sp. 8F]|uniref:TetR/AcrR family transcriptional regulator n=1 Tax=unclassified Tsukamurella TaxID=2633480 RepID=UPI0023B8C5D2|nr:MULTISPECIES: TetR family transcriptional regulator [unclassified Tsukamurella]MDF0529854.1 TetR family transcriptional regulator [Tsukamurella sp. 8J]MDF0587046.1 TetR family transcriptional regulator [Tsukamurella sp. 8F]
MMESMVDLNIRSLIGAGNMRERMRAEARRLPLRAMTRMVSRSTAIEAARQILVDKPWAEITMAEIATLAGISRQTLYKEFGSRDGLAEAYVLRFVDGFLHIVRQEVDSHPGDPHTAIREGFGQFLALAISDPLVRHGIAGPDPQTELLRLLTTDGGKIYTHATDGLTEIFMNSWAAVPIDRARVLSDGLVRLAISNVALRHGTPDSIARNLADLFTPFIERELAAARTGTPEDDGIRDDTGA